MANFAFWLGLMKAMPESFHEGQQKEDFRVAKGNFIKAARTGLATMLEWEGKLWPAPQLIQEILLPMAEKGLSDAGVNSADINKYLGIIENRSRSAQTGARWQVDNYRTLEKAYNRSTALSLLTEVMVENQLKGKPVHEWKAIESNKVYPFTKDNLIASKLMGTDLFVVKEDDFIPMVKHIMEWKDIRHLPVENKKGELVGLLTATNIRNWQAKGSNANELVNTIMVDNVVTVAPETPVEEIKELMVSHQIGCVPVVRNNRLMGIVTDTDITKLEMDAQFLEKEAY